MKIFNLIVICFFICSGTASANEEKYVFDKQHTSILFFVKHPGLSDKIGGFADYDGYYIFDQNYPDESMVDIIIKPAGIDTFSILLDKILQTKSWFNTEKYPQIHFKSTHITITGKGTADITGNLTLLGVTKPLTLHTIFTKAGIHPLTKKYVSGFIADAIINRSEFGMVNHVPFVGNDVRLHIDVEGIKENK